MITIILNNTNISDVYKQPTYFQVQPKSDIPNYLKITVDGEKKDKKYIISYYKEDYSFQNRNQLSQSNSGIACMWLNKEQIKKTFYFGIECSDMECDFLLNITQEKNIILPLGEQYTYYVTKENKNMTFIINGIPTINYEIYPIDSREDYKISVWAKGNEKIITELNIQGHENIKNEFNGYIIEIEELKEINYNFTVFANEGNLINVGAYFFNGENICQTPLTDFGTEFSFFFDKDIMKFICFLFPIGNYNLLTLLNRVYVHESSVFSNTPYYYSSFNEEYNICCLKMNEYSNYNKYFYYFQFNKNKNSNNDIINILPPLILGANYYISMNKGETIGLIPNKINDDFEYLTYYSKEIEGTYNVSIFNCKTYPFCKKYSNFLNDFTPLIYYNSTTITFNKNEYNNNITPNSYNQKLLLLTCQTKYCLLYAYMYTNKNNITLVPDESFYKYIEKDIEEKLILCMRPYIIVDSEKINWYLNIEILNGDIEIFFIGSEYYEYRYKNKILYEIKGDKNNEFLLKVKAKKNSLYSISTIFEKILEDEDYFLLPQMNYLLKMNKISNGNTVIINDVSKELYYINFYSINCKIDVKKMLNISVDINNRNEFYQDFINIFQVENLFNGYKITQVNNDNNNNCLYGLSLFRFQNNNKDLNSIILAKDIPKSFLFNKEYNKVKFMYFHTEKDLDIKIKLKLYDDEVYNITLFFNDILYDYFYIRKNEVISVESFNIKQKCIDDKQICKINLVISTQNKRNNSYFEIIFNTDDSKKYYDDNTLYIVLLY